MKLVDKGRFQAPPTLPEHAQRVSEATATWPGVHARAHWLLGDERKVDGADFYIGDEELGHIHLDGEAHIFLPLVVTDALVAAHLGRRLKWISNVIVFDIDRASGVEHALWLFRLSYDRLHGTPTAALLKRVSRRRATGEGYGDGGDALPNGRRQVAPER